MTTSCLTNSNAANKIYKRSDTENDSDLFNNTIKLQLKKPKRWNWELTTSKSSPNISFPRILLYNYKGQLLAEAKESDHTFKNNKQEQEQIYPTIIRSSSSSKIGSKSFSSSSISSNNKSNIRPNPENWGKSLECANIINKSNNSVKGNTENSDDRRKKKSRSLQLENIENLYSNLTQIKENSFDDDDESDNSSINNVLQKTDISSLVNNEDKRLNNFTNSKDSINCPNKNNTSTSSKEIKFDLQKSKSVSNISERIKKKSRSNNSAPSKFSESILERLSAFKRRSSSTDSEKLEQLIPSDTPKYILRTSNAGTLVICEESFKDRKIRRRQKSNPRNSEKKENTIQHTQEKIIPKSGNSGSSSNKSDTRTVKQSSAEFSSSSNKMLTKQYDKNDFILEKENMQMKNTKSDLKIQKPRKFKHIRRCRSVGIIQSSSEDEIEDQNKKPYRNRYKKKANLKEGDLCTNNTNETYCNGSNCNHNEFNHQKTLTESFGIKYYTLDRRNDIPTESMCSDPSNTITVPSNGVKKQDKIKYGGSLPNNLDVEDEQEEKNSNSACGENNITTNYTEYIQEKLQIKHKTDRTYLYQEGTVFIDPKSGTYKTNQDDRLCSAFKLLLTRTNIDSSYDQGYGSERSPEEEIVPHLFTVSNCPYQENSQTHNMDANIEDIKSSIHEFITEECTFRVQIKKGPRGLGLSIYGGTDSNAEFPGLIRIKRLFPHQAAWSTGKLQPGDIILEANDVSLTGSTNYEALEVLRTIPSDVVLLICRPNDDSYRKLSPPSEPPVPPQRVLPQFTQSIPKICPANSMASTHSKFCGEFEITMVKHQGSLGFTLRREDESMIGHYVRTLVREPATTDGRIKPGDKIIAVNDVPLSPMTHEQAVIFLRQAPDIVKLRLYRDEDQISFPTMSPTTFTKKASGITRKTNLRPEAINLLSDLAYKKQVTSGHSTESSTLSNTSPRRLKRGNKQHLKSNSHNFQGIIDSKEDICCSSSQLEEVYNDSEESTPSQCSCNTQELAVSDNVNTYDINQPSRPNTLDIAGQISDTMDTSRKSKSQFSVSNHAYELNNLNNEILDMRRNTLENSSENNFNSQLLENNEFTSLPCEMLLVSCTTENDLKGNRSLLKWKGVVFSPDKEKKDPPLEDINCASKNNIVKTPAIERDIDIKKFSSNPERYKIITVELNRGWNSRLGFSLQEDPKTNKTVIRAIYNDSIAKRDGRLKVGDFLIKVNENSVEGMETKEIIELLRFLRGSIAITVLRLNSNKVMDN